MLTAWCSGRHFDASRLVTSAPLAMKKSPDRCLAFLHASSNGVKPSSSTSSTDSTCISSSSAFCPSADSNVSTSSSSSRFATHAHSSPPVGRAPSASRRRMAFTRPSNPQRARQCGDVRSTCGVARYSSTAKPLGVWKAGPTMAWQSGVSPSLSMMFTGAPSRRRRMVTSRHCCTAIEFISWSAWSRCLPTSCSTPMHSKSSLRDGSLGMAFWSTGWGGGAARWPWWEWCGCWWWWCCCCCCCCARPLSWDSLRPLRLERGVDPGFFSFSPCLPFVPHAPIAQTQGLCKPRWVESMKYRYCSFY
eukprot:Rhum_TRINITY_DN10230_c0_g1::Rhum_TRINITY_DN10230_c0_g1_i1::g.37243::m.37243